MCEAPVWTFLFLSSPSVPGVTFFGIKKNTKLLHKILSKNILVFGSFNYWQRFYLECHLLILKIYFFVCLIFNIIDCFFHCLFIFFLCLSIALLLSFIYFGLKQQLYIYISQVHWYACHQSSWLLWFYIRWLLISHME